VNNIARIGIADAAGCLTNEPGRDNASIALPHLVHFIAPFGGGALALLGARRRLGLSCF
jgi:hypothetical protein